MATRNLNVVLSATDATLSTTLRRSAAELTAFSSTVNATSASVVTSSAMMGRAFIGIGTVVAAALVVGTHAAIQFERSMRNVTTISAFARANFDEVSASVIRLSTTLPQSADELAKGLYEIASSGFAGRDGLVVLEQSAKAASAGLSNTATASKAILGVLNAYGLGAEEARRVSDVLFETVNYGVVSFSELAQEIGGVLGMASIAGVSIEEVGAALATITLAGIPASEAVTSLNRTIQEIANPSKAMSNVLRELGFESGQTALKTLGLRETMMRIRDVVGDNIPAWRQLFPEIRGLRGALALTAGEGENWNRILKRMNVASEGAGATTRALTEQQKSFAFQWEVTKNQLMQTGIAIGTALIPVLKAVATVLGTLAMGFATLPGPVRTATIAIVALALAMRLLSPLAERGFLNMSLMAGSLGRSTNTIRTAHTAFTGLAQSLPKIATGGLIAAASFSAIGESTTSTAIGIAGMVAGGAMIGSVFPGAGTAIGAVAGGVIGLSKAMFDGGDSAEEYARRVQGVAAAMDGLGKQAAFTEFWKSLGSGAREAANSGDINAVMKDLEAFSRVNPTSMLKVVDVMKQLRSADTGKKVFSAPDIAIATRIVQDGAAAFEKLNNVRQASAAIAAAAASGDMAQADALLELANSGEAAAAAITDVHDATIKAMGGELGARQAMVDLHEAQSALNAAVEKYGVLSPEAAQAGRNLEKAALDLAAATDTAGASWEALVTRFATLPTDLEAEIKKFETLKFIAGEAGVAFDPVLTKLYALREAIVGLPEGYEIRATSTGFEVVKSEAEDVKTAVDNIPKNPTVDIKETGAEDTKTKSKEVKKTADEIAGKRYVDIEARDNASQYLDALRVKASVPIIQIVRTISTAFTPFADGGIVFFAGGTERHVAQIGRGRTTRVWNEPETGGEAYIPLAESKRGRSTEILRRVAQMFGYSMINRRAIEFASGGFYGGADDPFMIASEGFSTTLADSGDALEDALLNVVRALDRTVQGWETRFIHPPIPARVTPTPPPVPTPVVPPGSGGGSSILAATAAALTNLFEKLAQEGVQRRLDLTIRQLDEARSALSGAAEGTEEYEAASVGAYFATLNLHRAVQDYVSTSEIASLSQEALAAKFRDSPQVIEDQIRAFKDLQTRAGEAGGALQPVIDRLRGARDTIGGDFAIDARFIEQIDDIKKKLDDLRKFQAGLEESHGVFSPEARGMDPLIAGEINKYRQAILDYVGSLDVGKKSQAELIEQFKATPAALLEQIQRFEQLKTALGDAGGAVDPIIEQLKKVQEELGIAGEVAGGAASNAQGDKAKLEESVRTLTQYANQLEAIIKRIPTMVNVTVSVTDYAGTQLDYIREKASKPIIQEIHLVTRAMGSAANGAVLPYMSSFARGSENHLAEIATAGSWRIWAEPETGGEAYIPLGRNKRTRSVKILADVAERFGYTIVPVGGALRFAGGGQSRGGRSGGTFVRTELIVHGNVYGDTALKRMIEDNLAARDEQLAMKLEMNRG